MEDFIPICREDGGVLIGIEFWLWIMHKILNFWFWINYTDFGFWILDFGLFTAPPRQLQALKAPAGIKS